MRFSDNPASKRPVGGALWAGWMPALGLGLSLSLLCGSGCARKDSSAPSQSAQSGIVPSKRVLPAKLKTATPSSKAANVRKGSGALPQVELSVEEADQWATFLQPSEAEKVWDSVDWRLSVWDAVVEAVDTGRPLLMFSMNGHPKGFT